MRSFEIPQALHDEFSGVGNRLEARIEGFPSAEIIWGEDYPNTYLHIFLQGSAAARAEDNDPDFRITCSGAGSPWIRTSFELMEIHPFNEIIATCRQLYRLTDDYTRFARFPR